MENIITLYHGSNKIIRTPQYGAGKQKVDATKNGKRQQGTAGILFQQEGSEKTGRYLYAADFG